ncbi:immunoglobulin i-set domain-containing protein [Ditylenchus destructor]|uniref:Immunoglobulin i-set domain-containing protein n=1 Tax=Ditylenchus destructor TaxID=166010 RepID=A0AAD4RC46_9BILA|nr:immunoglobulin i-set domain-containing protein [Ditylenchus destructor]
MNFPNSARIVVIRDDGGPSLIRNRKNGRKILHRLEHGSPEPDDSLEELEGPFSSLNLKTHNRFYKEKKKSVPEFLNRLEDQWHQFSDNITLKINYRGHPDPVVTWFKDQQPILSTIRTMITAGEGNTELVIFDAEKLDSGFYTCRIENDIGVRETSCQIYIGDTGKLKSAGRKSLATSNYRAYRSILYNSPHYYSRY